MQISKFPLRNVLRKFHNSRYKSHYKFASQWLVFHPGVTLPVYSDEFVQDFHLFPFYPLSSEDAPTQRHRLPIQLSRRLS